MIPAILCALVALAASVWTTAYAWTASVPDLLWLAYVRQERARWDSIDALRGHLAELQRLDLDGWAA